MDHYQPIRELISRVRARWRALRAFRALIRVSLAGAVIVLAGVMAARWTEGAPLALALVAIVCAVASLAAVVWGFLPLRHQPGDRQVARFIEESDPSLDDRLVSAVDVASQAGAGNATGFAAPMLADAGRRAREVDVDGVVPSRTLRRAGLWAALASIVAITIFVGSRHTARRAFDAVALTFFPEHVTLDVKPGNARVRAGDPLNIEARLRGNRAPVIAQVQVAVAETWRATDMTTVAPGAFRVSMGAPASSFRYRVVAGNLTSPTYDLTVLHAPRVSRIDVDYSYPAGLGLEPRTERDGGDIYAPAGTDVRVHVFSDRPAAAGRMSLASGETLPLRALGPTELTAALHVIDNSSYRLALSDPDGLSADAGTEYFIRTLEDRPPEVHILKPAADRSVTRLEEVDVEAQAEDDYGIARMDLVYSLRGGPEQALALEIPKRKAAVTARTTLYLEDLNVQPGDFISYYVRARDITRGTRPNEARSDIFFLEVKPYEQEFGLAQSQSSGRGPGAGRGNIDDLVAAQKDVIVSTWKLDRRAQSAKGARSEQDIRTVSRAEAELRTRVEQASSGFRETTMRDPRRRPQPQRGGGRGGSQQPELKAGQALPEEDEMGAASAAMAQAVSSLDALKTADARTPEMEALGHLLKAQADVKKREIARQQAGNGTGGNRSNYDVSTLFDRELQKAQQTNYENRSSAEEKDEATRSELDKVRELARRQDELLKRQEELLKNRGMDAEQLKRELEKLTREQSDLRQQAEDLARQMASQSQASPSDGRAGQNANQTAQGPQQGQQGRGQKGQSQQQAQAGAQGKGGDQAGDVQSSDGSQRMRGVSEEMRAATNDLRRQDPDQASARGNRALDALRQIERQLQSAQPDERRRALGEMQLEARQIAEGERQIGAQMGSAPGARAAGGGRSAGENNSGDLVRRLAGDQQRLAERTRKLQDSLKQQSSAAGPNPRRSPQANQKQAQAAADAAGDIDRQRLPDRMQQIADALRASSELGTTAGRGSGSQQQPAASPSASQSGAEEMARALERVADKLASAGNPGDGDSQKLSERLARAQELRERLDALGSQMKQQGQSSSSSSKSASRSAGQNGRSGEGQQGGGGGSGTDLQRLRDEYVRTLQQTRDLMEQLRRENPNYPTFARGGEGFTFEGQGMTLSAPGTEAFKQDFARWEELRKQATQALESAETALSANLQARETRERLAAGSDDKAPPEYQKQVDEYFKAIAAKKRGS